MTIGIYLFKFPSNLPYIGQSIDIERRKRDHFNAMRKGEHSCKVQAEYDKYQVLPTFEILTECSVEELDAFENECIEIYDSVNNGLNTVEKAEDTPNGCISGGKISFNTHSKEQIEDVLYYLVYAPELTYPEISKTTGVSKDVVSRISAGQSHTWLEKEYSEDYAKLIELRSIRYKNMLNTATKHLTAEKKGIVYPKILAPCGTVYEVTNVTGFAKEHKLDPGTLNRLLNQTGRNGWVPPTHHKGWRLAPEEGVINGSGPNYC